MKPKEGASISGAVGDCDPLRKCWELTGPLQSAGAAMLLVAEPSILYPTFYHVGPRLQLKSSGLSQAPTEQSRQPQIPLISTYANPGTFISPKMYLHSRCKGASSQLPITLCKISTLSIAASPLKTSV